MVRHKYTLKSVYQIIIIFIVQIYKLNLFCIFEYTN